MRSSEAGPYELTDEVIDARLRRRTPGLRLPDPQARRLPVPVLRIRRRALRGVRGHEVPRRTGLVGTNSISQNRARGASLKYVVATGGVITDAVSIQKWPGEAKVHVSLVNWIKKPTVPPTAFVLDGDAVDGITAELRTPERSTGVVANLRANKGRCFQGPIPAGSGFVIPEDKANALLKVKGISYRDVVRPYLDGDDITEDPKQAPRRWIIDFAKLPLETAMKYPKALEIVRTEVKPVREQNNRAAYRHYWWQFAEARREMRTALKGLPH